MRKTVTARRRRELIGEAATSALRLEQQGAYAVDVETGWPGRWLDGDRTPPGQWGEGFEQWFDFIRAETSTGKRIERIRVVDDPPTDYQRWEAWLMAWNSEAGELIRYLPRAAAESIGITRDVGDWWMFDQALLLEMPFDDQGRERSMTLTDEPTALASALAMWETALDLCSPELAPV